MKIKNIKGLSLIEVLVAITILGIIGSFAIPRYTLYSNKSKQSEGKTSLDSIYANEKTFYFEHGYYDPRLDAIGFRPEGSQIYRVGFAADSGAAPLGTAGCINTSTTAACNPAYGGAVPWSENTTATTVGAFTADSIVSTPTPSSFKAEARANLTGADDVLNISSSEKKVQNTTPNLQ
ncbi:MAG: prepilin-type N-terminal cleavage/methylation domain-containing protein [Oligoflexia bacterium]|nr:prepilin-type N-terminal cleavage/methylation domain-containing protein [Oligoflexia bacterium]